MTKNVLATRTGIIVVGAVIGVLAPLLVLKGISPVLLDFTGPRWYSICGLKSSDLC